MKTAPTKLPWWHRAAIALEARVERAARARRRRGAAPAHVAAYRAVGDAAGVTLSGRVLADTPRGGPLADAPWWINLAGTFRRFATPEMPGVELRRRFGGVEVTTCTDDEGYYRARIDLPDGVRG